MSTQKNLVALAVGAIVATSGMAAFAGGVTATGGVVSTEYQKAVGANAGSARLATLASLGTSALKIKLNAEYALNDKITLTFACACISDTTLPSTLTTNSVGGQQLTFGLLSSSASSAVYRVTNRQNAATTKGLEIDLTSDLSTIRADMSLATSGVTITFSAATSSGDAFDTTIATADTDYASSASLVTLASQFTGKVDTPLLDGVIDVNPGGTTVPLTRFAAGTGGHSTTADALTLRTYETALTSPAVFFKTAEVSAVTYTVAGDFSWATEAKKASVFGVTCPTSSTKSAVTLATGSVSWSCLGRQAVGGSSSGGASTLTITVSGQTGLTALPTTTFTASSSVSYFSPATESGANGKTAASSVLPSTTAAGSWTINGAQIFVPYMPYGSTIDQIIYVANKSSVTGDVSLQYVGLDTTAVVNLGKIGSIGPNSTKNLAGLIRDALPAAAKESGRLALILTINAPVNDIDVLASYKIGDDRAFVQTRKLN